MRVLHSRLVQLEERKREEEIARETGAKREIAFGSQIRSYTLHPDGVLDGDIQPFIETWLREKAKGDLS